MSIHQNSLEAKKQLKIGGTHNRILQLFHITDRPMTDREVKTMLKYEDMNEVRPRITELVEMKRLVECGSVKDVKTHKTVRQTRLRRPEEETQWELF